MTLPWSFHILLIRPLLVNCWLGADINRLKLSEFDGISDLMIKCMNKYYIC